MKTLVFYVSKVDSYFNNGIFFVIKDNHKGHYPTSIFLKREKVGEMDSTERSALKKEIATAIKNILTVTPPEKEAMEQDIKIQFNKEFSISGVARYKHLENSKKEKTTMRQFRAFPQLDFVMPMSDYEIQFFYEALREANQHLITQYQ